VLIKRGWVYARRHLLRRYGIDAVTGMRFRRSRKMRVVGDKYGAWIIPDGLLGPDSICYCVGCGENVSFDLALIDIVGCNVWAFDPTPRAVQYVGEVAGHNPRYHFTAIGIWSEDTEVKFFAPQNPAHVAYSVVNLQYTSQFFTARVGRLSCIMAANNHPRLDLLKLDVEGAEYEILRSIAEDDLDIGVICVEFDEYFHPLDSGFRERIRTALDQLVRRGYKILDTPGNGNYTLARTR
jgi:FkbM family methyltransferase